MPQFKVNVKWGKQKLSADLTTEESPEVFKLQLYTLTNVLPERQKLMLKGAVLKDSWEGFRVKNGASLLLLGSAEALPKEPVVQTKFVEDMTEDELNCAMDMNTGLDNLGNTCYMNATIQMLSTVPEFSAALESLPANNLAASISNLSGVGSDPIALGKKITNELGSIMKVLAAKDQISFQPFLFLQYIYKRFPQFAEKNDHGVPMQQDANEFFSELLRLCQDNLPPPTDGASNSRPSFVDQFFGIEYNNTLKCADEAAVDEEPTYSKETSIQLNCFISQEIKFLLTGVKSKLKEEIEKNSPTLGRNAKYLRTSQIDRLPGYLCVQMVRFFFKEKGQVNAKILKDVKFPLAFDTFELCSPELQERLKPVREAFEADEEAKAEAAMTGKNNQPGSTNKPIPKEVKKKEAKEYEPYSFADDVGSNNSGHYELQAVITHQGRSSSSGHYVAWLRVEADNWVKCDDNDVTPVTQEEVLKLSGGGDWHIAYLLLYGPRRLEKNAAKMVVDAAQALSSGAVAMEATDGPQT